MVLIMSVLMHFRELFNDVTVDYVVVALVEYDVYIIHNGV